ncbi:MAG: ISAs1 family transposase [bacterium]|nr:ISAs1 family transposase [bacterium]
MRKRIPNGKPAVKKHLKRVAKIGLDKILTDPRSPVNMEWSFKYLINIIFYGMLTGQKRLRDVEDFSEAYYERVPDTTLYVLLSKIDPEPLRPLIAREVKEALHSHKLPKKFPVRITAVDGKCSSRSKLWVGDFSQESSCNGDVHYLNRVLRAAHVSNSTKLILGQREIKGKKSEMSEFIPFIENLLNLYGRTQLLEVISVDAGMNSLKNADFLIKKYLDYIMGLKNPQRKLLELAEEALGSREEFDKETIEYSNGKKVTRRLYRCRAPLYGRWTHLKQFWRIHQETKRKNKTEIEDRYFMTSLEYEKLNHTEVLEAVRMHWGIENNANWVFDTVWEEDGSPWCNKGFVFVTLLRILAYNTIALLKASLLRKKNDRERRWQGFFQLFNAALIEITYNTTIEPFIPDCK